MFILKLKEILMLIAANWKMNLGKSEIDQFCNILQSNEFHDSLDICIFPPSVYINYLNRSFLSNVIIN